MATDKPRSPSRHRAPQTYIGGIVADGALRKDSVLFGQDRLLSLRGGASHALCVVVEPRDDVALWCALEVLGFFGENGIFLR